MSLYTEKKLNIILVEKYSQSGYLNMKIDEFLFENFEKLAINPYNSIIFRFYNFANHTITLGYSQNTVDENIREEYKKWSFVKRITGGRAVFHYPKKDLTLCLISSIQTFEKLNINIHKNKIRNIHLFINNCLWDSVYPLLKNNKSKDIKNVQNKYVKFDCFQNIHDFEKVYNNKKVIGTAIKISDQKFIVQANIKLQYMFERISKDIINQIENNFLRKLIETENSHFYDSKEFYPLKLFDLFKLISR
ncbi:MAG: hypothetical protein RMJ36_03345 [Candidatus Calescibacterium sp.]|nr:hypothetical protein [Candidatus Calescibacterium sp.]MDW8132671.1 hypothetical protein [Candidatus Calescibacterium sp.]